MATPENTLYSYLLKQRCRVCMEATSGRPTEMQLQTLWQSSRLRKQVFSLADGTPVEILEPGRWNRSAGPDFQDALISLGGFVRRGDVELHVCPHDWDLHRHSGDAAYSGLILHVTWETEPKAETLPRGVPALALRPALEHDNQPFIFPTPPKSIYAPRPDGTDYPCNMCLRREPETLKRLLSEAGRFRLQTKARVFAANMCGADPFQAFYEALLSAMGYGGNSGTFKRLAREVPFSRIAHLTSLQRLAALAGVSGLLREQDRTLWDLWWEIGIPPPVEPFSWTLRGLRPQNHPLRRLAGAIGILHQIEDLFELPMDKLSKALTEASGLLREYVGSRSALIGKSRANAIIVNLFVPYRLMTGSLSASALNHLPGEAISMPMREVWHRLTGSLHDLPTDGLFQQALLQLYADFCHNDAVTCGVCPIAQLG